MDVFKITASGIVNPESIAMKQKHFQPLPNSSFVGRGR
jgi:hypothetical protein